jgi:hypothetical protein
MYMLVIWWTTDNRWWNDERGTDYFRPGELKKKIDYKQVGCVQCSKAKTEKKKS